jgi:purine-binding chemotaxis protein CheW
MQASTTVTLGLGAGASLLCRQQRLRLVLPLAHVVEVMRPLAVEAMPGMPFFVRGVSVIRGTPVPVVDAAGLLVVTDGPAAGRWVVLRAGTHRFALAVEAVEGVVELPSAGSAHLPALLRHGRAEAISALGALDADLLVVVRATSVLSDADWRAFAERGSAP